MRKRHGQFETVPVQDALRSAMKDAAAKVSQDKTEPYATTVIAEPDRAPEQADEKSGH